MSERLDRIEEILANLAQQQQITPATLNQVSDRLNQVSEQQQITTRKLDQVSDRLDQVSEQQQHNTIAIGKLTKRMDDVTSRFDSLVYETQRIIRNSFGSLERLESSVEVMTDAVTRLTRNAAQDRQAIRDIQAENRQIWQYLLRKSSNGNSPTDL